MRVRAAAVVMKDNSILLVKHQKRARSYWLLPGGGVRAGERVTDALSRELAEELHIEFRGEEFLFVVETISGEGMHFLQPTYRVDASNLGGIRLGEDDRVVDWGFFTRDDLSGLLIYPDIAGELGAYLSHKSIEKNYIYKKWKD
jgi:8-oxo-dGTP diphosphatase